MSQTNVMRVSILIMGCLVIYHLNYSRLQFLLIPSHEENRLAVKPLDTKNGSLYNTAQSIMHDAAPIKVVPVSHQVPEPQSLKIAWLITFPNSGTSYTSKLIRHVSLTRTASNYGNESKDAVGLSRAVFTDQPGGPFWHGAHAPHPGYTFPQNYVLTKTHCGGYCEWCPPTEVRALSVFSKRSAQNVTLFQSHSFLDVLSTSSQSKVSGINASLVRALCPSTAERDFSS
jgi:hypothetical protein